METVVHAVTAAAFCIAVAAVIWAVKGKLLAPERCGAKLFTVVRLENGAEDMEQLCLWLRWLRESGSDIRFAIISDRLSSEEKKRAKILTDSAGGTLVSAEELVQMIGDLLWQEKTAT